MEHELVDITIEALKMAAKYLEKHAGDPEAAILRKYILSIKKEWEKPVAGFQPKTKNEISVDKNKAQSEPGLEIDLSADRPFSIHSKIRMMEEYRKKLFKEFGETTKTIADVFSEVRNAKSLSKAKWKKLLNRLTMATSKAGISEEQLKEDVLSGEYPKIFGGKWGAKKIATKVMEHNGGLIDKGGRLKYHADKKSPNYRKLHKALANKIQRWMPGK